MALNRFFSASLHFATTSGLQKYGIWLSTISLASSIPSTVSLYPDCTYSLVNVSSGQSGV
uniref:Uncharacterized protein n=1 Tax=Arundo donax TaxID=35708 RepID=A0A0A9CW64_ARUDO